MSQPTLTNLLSSLEIVKAGVLRKGSLPFVFSLPSDSDLQTLEMKVSTSILPARLMLRIWMLPYNKAESVHVSSNGSSRKQFLLSVDEMPMPNGYGIETLPQDSWQPGRAWLAAAKAISKNTVSLVSCFCVSFNLIVAICAQYHFRSNL